MPTLAGPGLSKVCIGDWSRPGLHLRKAVRIVAQKYGAG